MLSQSESRRYTSVGESDDCPSFITSGYKNQSNPQHAISSLTLPILYLLIHWFAIISIWFYLRNTAYLLIILLNMIICSFLIPYRNLKFVEVNRIQKFANFIPSINEMIQSPPQIYQLFYWNEITSKDCNDIYYKRHHHQELFDQFVWINMSNTNDITNILLTNDIKCIMIPIELKFSFDSQTAEQYEIWKEECSKKMSKIKKEETDNGKWDGIMFHKHLEMDIFKPLHGIHNGQIRYLCYWRDSYYMKKLQKHWFLKYIPMYFIMNLIFGALGLTLFCYFKYIHLFVCLLHCVSYIEYNKIVIHKKLYNIQKIKRLLLLDILQNDCQKGYDEDNNNDYNIEVSSYYGDMINISDEQNEIDDEKYINDDIIIEKIPDKILDLCVEFTPDCLVPNRIHYDSASHYYSSSYHK